MTNPNPDSVIMSTMSNLILPGTAIAANSTDGTGGLSQVFIEQKYTMVAAGLFPAVHLSAGDQSYQIRGYRDYEGMLVVNVEYYHRWEGQIETLDQIRADIRDDLAIIKNNLEKNRDLTYQAQPHAVCVQQTRLTPYEGMLDHSFSPLVLVKRCLYVTIQVLPYDAM